jgi:excisionase family DNA binding protein
MANKTDNGGELLRLAAVARELGISRTTAYAWAKQGKLPATRLHERRGLYVPRAALAAFERVLAEQAVDNLGHRRTQ